MNAIIPLTLTLIATFAFLPPRVPKSQDDEAMNDERKIAYLITQAACAQIEAMGLLADNIAGRPSCSRQHFEAIIEKYGIHRNAVLAFLDT